MKIFALRDLFARAEVVSRTSHQRQRNAVISISFDPDVSCDAEKQSRPCTVQYTPTQELFASSPLHSTVLICASLLDSFT
jgi:hypothetical protein